MLSTPYRLRLSAICKNIAIHGHVSLEDRMWAQKLGEANRTAAEMLRRAHRQAANPEMQDGSMDAFLNALDIGGIGDQAKGVRGFNSPDEIADFFKRDDTDDWRQRD